MIRRIFLLFGGLVLASIASAYGGLMLGNSSLVFNRLEGLQTNSTELDRFIALSGSGDYATDLSSVTSHAETARDSWPYTR